MILYTDIDEKCCAWMRELVKGGHIPVGDVKCASIKELDPDELRTYIQVHLFCGIAGWPYALQLAEWPIDRPVWTGSCPCQPFSAAGKRKGTADERHLWPDMFRLIRECKPPTVIGEQVASKGGLGWLDGVFADLEGAGYACGAADLCAAGVGAPHIRQRLWWVANTSGAPGEWDARGFSASQTGVGEKNWPKYGHLSVRPGDGRPSGGMADSKDDGHEWLETAREGRTVAAHRGRVGIAASERLERIVETGPACGPVIGTRAECWDDFILIPCGDGKTRRLEPSISPLAHGLPARVVRLRGYGNAIVPQVAAEFAEAVMNSAAEMERSVR